jgi:hypothetical protein
MSEGLGHYHVTIKKVSCVTFEDVFAHSKEEAEDAAESSAYGGAGQYCFDDYEFEMDAELQTDDLKEVKEAWIEQFGDEDVDEMFTRG